jgi:hypothetical protein
MSGRTLRKEGQLLVKLIETPSAMQRFTAVTLKGYRPAFENWRSAHVTLR